VDGARDERRVVSAQQLQVHKEESLVAQPTGAAPLAETGIEEWTTETAAEDVLHELIFRQSGDGRGITLRVERRRAIVLKQVAVKIIRSGFGDERYLRAAAASELRGEVTRYHLKFLHRIGVGP